MKEAVEHKRLDIFEILTLPPHSHSLATYKLVILDKNNE